MTVTIRIRVPSRDEPGFLRRQRRILELRDKLSDPTPQLLDELVEFLVEYVVEPADRDAAREALWDASEKQLFEALQALAGVEQRPLPQTVSSESSTQP